MREFAVEFTDGLKRGLRAFPNPTPEKEELIECHNLVPSEHELMNYEPVLLLEIPSVPNSPGGVLTCQSVELNESLLYCWDMDEASGDRIDHVANLHLTGGCGAGVTGKNGLALPFTGTEKMDMVSPLQILSIGGSYTFALWFKVTNLSANRPLFVAGDSSTAGQYYYLAFILQDGSFLFYREGGWGSIITAPGIISPNIWYLFFIVTTLNIATMYIYNESGLILTQGSGATPPVTGGSGAITIGGEGTGPQRFVGLMDSLIIWQRALTADDRLLVWNDGNGI
jgi:hypothetical protein